MRNLYRIGYIAAVTWHDQSEWPLNKGDLCTYYYDKPKYGAEVFKTKDKAIKAALEFSKHELSCVREVYVRDYMLETNKTESLPIWEGSNKQVVWEKQP